MGKLLFALVIFLAAFALFKWPGCLVRDDAGSRLGSALKAPERFLRNIADLGEKEDGASTASGQGDPFGSPGNASGAGGDYPLPMTIQNTTGTALDVTVLGKGPDFLRFRRNSDQRLFDLKFSLLAEASRSAVASLPTNLGPQDYQKASPAKNTAPPEPRTSLADGIRKEIERNERQIQELRSIVQGNLFTSSQKSMASKKLARLREENIRLKIKLADYEATF